jgi:Tfp pilus assembly protein PilX
MKHSRNASAASASVVTLAVLSTTMLGVVGVFHLMNQQVKLASLNRERDIARGMAESGIDVAVQKIYASSSYTGEETTVISASGTPQGSYTTNVSTLPGGTVLIRSTGHSMLGVKVSLVATAEITRQPPGATGIISNGPIRIASGATLRTLPAGSHCAGLTSNDRITIEGSCNIDGTVRSRLDVQAAGSIYKKCENQPRVPFPSQKEVEKCRSNEYTKACSGGTRYGDVSSSTTITGPKRISGDIKCGSGERVVLKGPGTIYVDGNVELDESATLENGTCLVVNGTFIQNSRSCYRIDKTVTAKTPTLMVCGNRTSSCDFVPSTTCTIRGSSVSTDHVGIVQVCKGDLEIKGNASQTGCFSVISGKTTVSTGSPLIQTLPSGINAPIPLIDTYRVLAVIEQ